MGRGSEKDDDEEEEERLAGVVVQVCLYLISSRGSVRRAPSGHAAIVLAVRSSRKSFLYSPPSTEHHGPSLPADIPGR